VIRPSIEPQRIRRILLAGWKGDGGKGGKGGNTGREEISASHEVLMIHKQKAPNCRSNYLKLAIKAGSH